MSDSQPQADPAIIATFKKRRMRQILCLPFVVVAVAALVFIDEMEKEAFLGIPSTAILIGGCVIIFGVLIFSLFNWRCPSCSGYLGKSLGPKFCQKCGSQLRDS